MRERPSYGFGDVLRLVGVERSQLVRWTDTGTIAAEHGGAGRSGKHRRFSFKNLIQIAVAQQLDALGFGLADISRVLGYLDADDPEMGGSIWQQLGTLRGRRRWGFFVETRGVAAPIPPDAVPTAWIDRRGKLHETTYAARTVVESGFGNAAAVMAALEQGLVAVVVNLGEHVTELEKRTGGDTLGG